MNISDANPIQFWLTGSLSYNENSVNGIYDICFYQTFNCSDTIRLQITDSDISKYYDLKIFDSNNNLLSTTSFTRSLRYANVDGLNIYDFTIFDVSISLESLTCNQFIKFKIFDQLSNEVAHSDKIEITDNAEDCTVLIEYSNNSTIAGMHFAEESPSIPNYYLRIPGVFYFENYPQEQEDLELSTDEILTLWSKTEAVRMMDIGFVPDYMHKKMALITQMDTLIIDSKNWRRREGYQITQGSKRYPLRKASVNLTQQDFINRNVL